MLIAPNVLPVGRAKYPGKDELTNIAAAEAGTAGRAAESIKTQAQDLWAPDQIRHDQLRLV
jgi:hypothetical protein